MLPADIPIKQNRPINTYLLDRHVQQIEYSHQNSTEFSTLSSELSLRLLYCRRADSLPAHTPSSLFT